MSGHLVYVMPGGPSPSQEDTWQPDVDEDAGAGETLTVTATQAQTVPHTLLQGTVRHSREWPHFDSGCSIS